MDLLRHWVVKPPRWNGKITEQYVVNEIEVGDFRTQGWTVEGPFVLEADAGAVDSAVAHSAPDRIWTNAHAGSILTGSERIADEMRALGDTLVGYVRADLCQGAVAALADRLYLDGPLSDDDPYYEAGWNAAVEQLRTYVAGGQ